MYWTDSWKHMRSRHLHSRYVREMEISLSCCWVMPVLKTLTCNTAASVCVCKSLSQMEWLHSSINLQALLLSTFSADIFLIVYMIPCMGSTQVHELAPYVRFIIYRDTQHFCYFARVFCLNSGAKCEFLCKMSSAPWLWSCSNFFLCWLTQLYFSAGIWGHTKPYCSHKFEMHTQDILFHW